MQASGSLLGSLFVRQLGVRVLLFSICLMTSAFGQAVQSQQPQQQPAAEPSVTRDAAASPEEAKATHLPPSNQVKSESSRTAAPGDPAVTGATKTATTAPESSGESRAENRDTQPRTVKDQARRLDEIEKVLRELLQEVQSLRGKPAETITTSDTATPEPQGILPDSWLKTLAWRPIGPANMGGRIVDLAVNRSDPNMFWVATASGGLLKTSNNGMTFVHQFDKENTVSIGAVAVAPSDANIIWVGTGENNPRNSVSYGDGVYRSTDGGKTWKPMGLNQSFQIGRIAIHPNDPNVVYVGALGRLYGPNEQRGLFKTTDGGATWQKVLYVDNQTGVIDMVMHPTDPETLIVAMWERLRDGFDSWPGNEVPRADGYDGYDPIKKWGPGSGLYKTSDGGQSWTKLTNGLPTNNMGRIGLDWYHKDPNVVLAVIDCENIGKGPPPLDAYLGAVGQDRDGKATLIQVIPDSSAAKAGLQVGDVITAVDDQPILEFDRLLDQLRKRRPGDQVKIKTARGDEPNEFEIVLSNRPAISGGLAVAGGVWLGVAGENRGDKATITRVITTGPAAKAGVEEGDIVVALAGKPLSDYNQLIEQIRSRRAGEKVQLTVNRGNQTKEIEVTLEDRPSGPTGQFGGRPTSNVYLGIQGEDAEGGARLTQITEDGPAEQAGLFAGDVVQAVDRKPTAGYEPFVEEIRSRQVGDKMTLSVRRGEETKEIVVILAERPGGPSRTRPYSFSLGGQSANVQDQQGAKGYEYGGVYKSTDGGQSWTRINSLNSRPMYFSVIRVDPSDDNYVYLLGVRQFRSSNGGQTFDGNFGRGVHADGHALWIDSREGRHMIIGTDGGTYVTYDRGANWDHLNHTAIGQFYHVAISPSEPYAVTGGLQDNGTWFGPSLSKSGSGPINEDWISVGGGDGFMCRVDPDDPDLVYYTSQNGNMRRRNLRTGEGASIRPQRASGAPTYRFNWNTPFILSNHNSRIFYCAGNYVFRSLNRGDHLQAISPEITLTKRGSATALSESPKNSNLLYVGTDDGALWVTRNGGHEWTEISKNVGLSAPRWVATIEASRFEEGRVYVAFDGHRSDDDDPYLYVSEDFGTTWRSLRANLPWGSTRCLREDLENQDLVFVGTEFGAWFSVDRGRYWNKLNTNLPTVAVHEIAVHPNNGELVAATHGRSLWITDISALRQINLENLESRIALYKPSSVIRWHREPSRGRTNRRFVGDNPASGAQIYYSLPKQVERVSLRILDIEGHTVRELRAANQPGLHRVAWDLTRIVPQRQSSSAAPSSSSRLDGPRGASGQRPGGQTAAATSSGTEETAASSASQRQSVQAAATAVPESAERQPAPPEATTGRPTSGRRGSTGTTTTRPAPSGTYRVVLTVDGQEFTQTVRVQPDPTAPADAIAAENAWSEKEDIEEEELRELYGPQWIDD